MPLSQRELASAELTGELYQRLRSNIQGRLLQDEPLSAHTSFRVGGPAKFYAFPATTDEIGTLLNLCQELQLDYFIIGYGTNLLVSDEGFAGCVIDLAEACRILTIGSDDFSRHRRLKSSLPPIICAGAGVEGGDVVRQAAAAGLAGLEKLAGIPGGIGGWVQMNAGAFRTTVSDHLIDLEIMEKDGSLRRISRAEAGFAYRASPGLNDKIILSAQFELEKAPAMDVLREVEATIAERHKRGIMTMPSAGSVFKNPTGHFAARLLEAVGAKGMREGGVEVSSSHANFIVNIRGGTAADIIRLIDRLRELVRFQFNVELELELKTLGFDGA
ncbi:MAG: UDP-N-acetylmuramate dehydrogenase [Calditrichota bacterium]